MDPSEEVGVSTLSPTHRELFAYSCRASSSSIAAGDGCDAIGSAPAMGPAYSPRAKGSRAARTGQFRYATSPGTTLQVAAAATILPARSLLGNARTSGQRRYQDQSRQMPLET